MKCKCSGNAIVTKKKTPEGMNKEYAMAHCPSCGKHTGWANTNSASWEEYLREQIGQ